MIAGVVLVPVDGPAHPLDQVVAEPRVHHRVRQLRRLRLVPEPVRLQVALVDHVQPVLVAQDEEVRVRRVVAGADRVDPGPLHQQYVVQHVLLGQRATAVGVELVPVDPVEEHAVAVHGEHTVGDRDRAEADPQPDVTTLGPHHAVVQARALGAPRLDGRGDRGLDRSRTPGPAPVRRQCPATSESTVSVPVPSAYDACTKTSVGRGRLEREQVDLAEDPGQPPHVLVLDVAAGRPLVHPDRDPGLLAGGNQVGEVELGRQPGAGRPADQLAVHVHGEPGVDTLEPQHHPGAGPVRRDRHGPDVVTGRVVGRHVRRLERERVDDVRVRRSAVPAQLPVTRDRDGVPPGGVRVLQVVGRVGHTRREPEAPVAGQRELGRVVVQPGTRGKHVGAGSEVLDVAVVMGHRHRA